jgi:excinuclease ABC subunit C
VADPATYRPAPGSIPEAPGVYRFLDDNGRVIYVGKAKSLRSRLNSYFARLIDLHPRTQTMVQSAARIEWTVVQTEVEALQLEYSWIKEFDPRFNVRYRDDKSYPSLAVTLYEDFPRLQVMRGPKRKGVRYFGPYSHAWAIRETLDLLLRVFPARTCSSGVFKRAQQVGRPCLLGYIDKCSAPCVGRVSAEEHRRIVEDFCDFMSGQTATYVRRLEKDMRAASAALEFERAARLRDDIGALNRAMEKQAVVFGDGTDADVVAFAEDELEAAVQIFHVRAGRVRGQRGMVVDKVEDVDTAALVERFLEQFYLEAGNEIPREVLVPALPDDADVVTEILRLTRGGRVDLRVPQRGDKRALMETVAVNAQQALGLHKTKRASDLTTRSRALQEIQLALELPDAPLRIECYDVSNLQGSEVVASMVVFEDGLARKSEYRRFTIRGISGQDDVAAIHEVVSRRFRRYLEERETAPDLELDGGMDGGLDGGLDGGMDGGMDGGLDGGIDGGDSFADDRHAQIASAIDPDTGRPRKFAYPPNLVVVDGGPPQVASAARALAELGIDDVSLCGLAKRLEEVWLPGEDHPVVMPRTSEGLYLLQRVRDEAHRFAITFHRQRRSKSMTASALDDVPGVGETRRKALLRHFGSLKKLAGATVDEVAQVPGVGLRTAQAVVEALAARAVGAAGQSGVGQPMVQSSTPAVDMGTGEILDDPPGDSPVPIDQETLQP